MRHLTHTELKTLLSAVLQPRHRLMILVTYHHGLRVSEVTSLTAAHIQGGYVRAARLKGSDPTVQRFVRHPDPDLDEAAALTELARTLKPQERLFPITRQRAWAIMQAAGRRGGLDHIKMHPHILKHSIAMHQIKVSGIHEVQKRLGHKSLSSTGAYLKVSDAEADDAYDLAVQTMFAAHGLEDKLVRPLTDTYKGAAAQQYRR